MIYEMIKVSTIPRENGMLLSNWNDISFESFMFAILLGPQLSLDMQTWRHGRCAYDVCIEGGEGGFKNLPILQMNSTDRLREMQTKEGGGSKTPKTLQTPYVNAPYIDLFLPTFPSTPFT